MGDEGLYGLLLQVHSWSPMETIGAQLVLIHNNPGVHI